ASELSTGPRATQRAASRKERRGASPRVGRREPPFLPLRVAGSVIDMQITRKEPVMNIAARAARWRAAHSKTATFGGLAFAAAAVAAGTLAGTHKLTGAESSTGESAHAEQILTRAGIHDRAAESVLVQSKTSTAGDPAFRRTVGAVVGALQARHEVTN